MATSGRQADEPLRKRQAPSFAAEVAESLRGEIESGALPAGAQLPTEAEISGRFGVSRPVVREAISVLRHDGLVESRQGSGSFVAAAPLASTYRLPATNLESTAEMELIMEFLMVHEVAATRLAARRRSKADVAALRLALDGMATAIAAGSLGVDEDFRFHDVILKATRNPFFISFNAFLEQRVRNLIRTARSNTARFAGLAARVQDEHRAIFEAIAAGDEDAAGLAAERHLRNAAGRLKLYRRHG